MVYARAGMIEMACKVRVMGHRTGGVDSSILSVLRIHMFADDNNLANKTPLLGGWVMNTWAHVAMENMAMDDGLGGTAAVGVGSIRRV